MARVVVLNEKQDRILLDEQVQPIHFEDEHASLQILERLASNDPRLRVVTLSRPFGHQTALTAGLDHATGDAVVMIDADLQDPPEVIPDLLERWRAGSDIVYAVRA